jgi:hypothetical protein
MPWGEGPTYRSHTDPELGIALAVHHCDDPPGYGNPRGQREKSMRKSVMPFVLSVGLIAIGAGTAAAASTREEYALQADPICRSSDRETSRLFKRFWHANKKFRIHAAGNALAAIGRRLLSANNQLRAIEPPSGDEAVIAQWIHIWDKVSENFALAASDYRLGWYGRVEHLFKASNRLGATARHLVAGFPFQACA